MASELVREMLDAGIHFGHRCSRWNPKMQPFIYGKRNNIHVIDIRETLRGLLRAKRYISRVVGNGQDVLFVGTKRQARDIVQQHSERAEMPYVIERWLGGTLTNFRTIRSRLQRLEELEALVASPQWETGYSKKMKSTLSRELAKIRRNLSGVRTMQRLPAAIICVDVRKEMNAIREARSLGIPAIAITDTDSDPTLVDIPIPANDDAMRGIEIVVRELAEAALEGKKGRPETGDAGRDEGGPSEGRPRRRGGMGGARRGPRGGEETGDAGTPEAAADAPASAPEGAAS